MGEILFAAALVVAAPALAQDIEDGPGPNLVRDYFGPINEPVGPVIVAYRRQFAVTKKCGDWSKSMAVTYENKPYPNFGCSQQHNIAAMAVNPRDLKTPRGSSSIDAGRIDTVYEKYRKGESTTSQRGNSETGTVSDVQ